MERKAHLDRMTFISGGQTGIDRAMLDFCLDYHLRCGGWCPGNRQAEDGIINPRYPVKELPGASYTQRTLANVRESDATVIIFHGEMTGGTLKSREFALGYHKPILMLNMQEVTVEMAAAELGDFIQNHQPDTLNFSGPRKSEWEEGYRVCRSVLQRLFR
jgi:hypothetical protein